MRRRSSSRVFWVFSLTRGDFALASEFVDLGSGLPVPAGVADFVDGSSKHFTLVAAFGGLVRVIEEITRPSLSPDLAGFAPSTDCNDANARNTTGQRELI